MKKFIFIHRFWTRNRRQKIIAYCRTFQGCCLLWRNRSTSHVLEGDIGNCPTSPGEILASVPGLLAARWVCQLVTSIKSSQKDHLYDDILSFRYPPFQKWTQKCMKCCWKHTSTNYWKCFLRGLANEYHWFDQFSSKTRICLHDYYLGGIWRWPWNHCEIRVSLDGSVWSQWHKIADLQAIIVVHSEQ